MSVLVPVPIVVDSRRIPPAGATFRHVVNMRRAQDGTWRNDRGLEPLKLYPDEAAHNYTTNDFATMRFLGVFTRHDDSEVYYIYEKNGYLIYEMGNGDAVAAADRIFLDSNRRIPRSSQPGTQMIQIGDVAVICNGEDGPLKFFGRERIEAFGFPSIPPSPLLKRIEPDFRVNAAFVNGPSVAMTLPAVGFPEEAAFGLTESGDTGTFAWNYVVSFVSDTGSEGPLSSPATLCFDISASNRAGRYVAFLELPIGPAGTVARRVYRTHQLAAGSDGAGKFYLVDQIDDNASVDFTDHVPDSYLVSAAPGSDSVARLIVPTPNFGYLAQWNGRLWIAGGQLGDRLMYSCQQSAEPPKGMETFEAGAALDLGSSGGRITALVAEGQFLVIFRSRSISVVVREGDVFKIQEVSLGVGTLSPNAIVSIPGFGLVFPTTDAEVYLFTTDTTPAGSVPISPRLKKISASIDEDLRARVLPSASSLPRACAAWNPSDRTAWFHFPVDGDNEATHGWMLTLLDAESGVIWTEIRAKEVPQGHSRAFVFTRMVYDHTTKKTLLATFPYDTTIADGAADGAPEAGTWRNMGIQALTGKNTWGKSLSGGTAHTTPGDTLPTYTFSTQTNVEREPAYLETHWLDFSTPQSQKVARAFELDALATGWAGEITVSYGKNGRPGWTRLSSGPKYAVHPHDRDVFRDKVLQSTSGSNGVIPNGDLAFWDQSVAVEARRVRLIWKIDESQFDTIRFKIEIPSQAQVALLGCQIEVEESTAPELPAIPRRRS